ncbi:MAG: hypothetical protein GDA48_10055 [Hormoscilla sp. GM102CHS1]|nr:hypothetical protein [Hormoscilla sp. GM102CHS1]
MWGILLAVALAATAKKGEGCLSAAGASDRVRARIMLGASIINYHENDCLQGVRIWHSPLAIFLRLPWGIGVMLELFLRGTIADSTGWYRIRYRARISATSPRGSSSAIARVLLR